MYRHGDVLVAPVAAIPAGAQRLSHVILAHGEVTGHMHRIADPSTADLWEINGELFLNVTAAQATLIHDEHKPIVLPQGYYRVWRQREYTPQSIRTIRD